MTPEEIVAECVPQLLGPRAEAAWWTLHHAGLGGVPLLIEEFRRTSDPRLRRELVDIVYESVRRATPDVLAFLLGLVSDPDPHVWRRSLDGLVGAGDTSSIPEQIAKGSVF